MRHRYVSPSPFWLHLSPRHQRNVWRTKRFARSLAKDPGYRAKVGALIEDARSRPGRRDTAVTINEMRVKFKLSDRNPMPVFRFWRWLP